MCTHNLCLEQKYEKYQRFLSENFQFLEVKFSIYLNRHVFIMCLGLRCLLRPVCINTLGYTSYTINGACCKILCVYLIINTLRKYSTDDKIVSHSLCFPRK